MRNSFFRSTGVDRVVQTIGVGNGCRVSPWAKRRPATLGCHVALVFPGGVAGPYTVPLLVPSLAVEETVAQVKVVRYPELRPRGLKRAHCQFT